MENVLLLEEKLRLATRILKNAVLHVFARKYGKEGNLFAQSFRVGAKGQLLRRKKDAA